MLCQDAIGISEWEKPCSERPVEFVQAMMLDALSFPLSLAGAPGPERASLCEWQI